MAQESNTKYFPEESLKYWDKLGYFSGFWEQVETGKYLPLVVIDGENLGTDGDPEEVEKALRSPMRTYRLAGSPKALHIGSRESPYSTQLFWRDNAGNYYEDTVCVMEVDRWCQNVLDRNRKRKK